MKKFTISPEIPLDFLNSKTLEELQALLEKQKITKYKGDLWTLYEDDGSGKKWRCHHSEGTYLVRALISADGTTAVVETSTTAGDAIGVYHQWHPAFTVRC